MTRIVLSIAALAAILCCGAPASHALTGNAPWCAVTETGADEVEWDCEYPSAAECAPAVVAGNRGFCSINPYFAGPRHPRRHKWQD